MATDEPTAGAPAKTLEELIQIFGDTVPLLDDKVAKILEDHPDLFVQTAGAGKPPPVKDMMLGRIVAIAILDFLCYAFDRPDLGYLPPGLRHS